MAYQTNVRVNEVVSGSATASTTDSNFTVAVSVPISKVIRHVCVTVLPGDATSCYDVTIGSVWKVRILGMGVFPFYPNILTTGTTSVTATAVSGTAAGATSRLTVNYSD